MKSREKQKNLLDLFHHGHHQAGEHEWHHCGGRHKRVGYKIKHCACGLHRIDKQMTIGDTVDEKLTGKKVKIKFTAKCLESGWHIESGIVEAN